MDRPTECRWCGCGVRSRGKFTTFQCWTSVVLDNGWSQSTECKLKGLEKRIQRAVDTLKAANRFVVENGGLKSLWWDTNPDCYVTDSKAVDEALAILEGERNEP